MNKLRNEHRSLMPNKPNYCRTLSSRFATWRWLLGDRLQLNCIFSGTAQAVRFPPSRQSKRSTRLNNRFKASRVHLSRTQAYNRKILIEGLETRYLMAVAPVARDDSAYFTSLNTDLVISTSSSQSHLLANDLDLDGGTQTISVALQA